MPTNNALIKAAGRISQSVCPSVTDQKKLQLQGRRGEDGTRLGVQYARMVCNQLIQTPLKEKSTPPSLSLYPDRAIVEGALDHKSMGEGQLEPRREKRGD